MAQFIKKFTRADNIIFDNTTSNITATDLQSAILEVAQFLKLQKQTFSVSEDIDTFTLNNTPDPSTVILILDGITLEDVDFSVTGNVVTTTDLVNVGQVVKILYQRSLNV